MYLYYFVLALYQLKFYFIFIFNKLIWLDLTWLGGNPPDPTKLPPTHTLHGATFCMLLYGLYCKLTLFPPENWKLDERCGIFILFQVLVLKNKGQAAC